MGQPFFIVRTADEPDALRDLGFTQRFHEIQRMQRQRRRLRAQRATRFPLRSPLARYPGWPLRGPRR